MARTAAQDRAYQVGRNARQRGLDLHSTNVELARKLGWRTRADFNDALLDQCEHGWRVQDELMDPRDEDIYD